MRKPTAFFLVLALTFSGLGFLATTTDARGVKNRPVILKTQHKFAPVDLNAKAFKEEGLPVGGLEQSDSFRKPSAQPDRRVGVADEQLRRKLTSRSAILMDAKTGEVIYEQRADLPGQPASTLKVITGLIAIQSLNDPEMVPVSRRAASMPRSKVYLKPGNNYCANDLINAVLLASANDASVALAEKIAGSEPLFARLMTQKARAWGATNTVCKTASGLTAPGQQTTVRDLAVLFNRAMENDEFASRVKQNTARTNFGQVLRNHNRALWQITGAEGGKTGFTKAARQTYVGKFKRGDDELVLAIMGSVTMWKDIKNLVGYGFTVMAKNDREEATRTASASGASRVIEDGG